MRASTESQKSEHFHCWCQTLRLCGVLFHPASEKEIVRDFTEKRTSCFHRDTEPKSIAAEKEIVRDFTEKRTSCFHHDTEPKSIAAEKEIVRDVTEKRLLHRVFIATQSPNRLPQRRRLFVMSQRNVCYIVFSSRHRAHVAEHARRYFVSITLETTSPACFRFSTCGFSVRCPTSAFSMNSPCASRWSPSH